MNWPKLLSELSWVEWAAVLATGLNVWLVMRAHIYNFALGIVAVCLYSWVFWQQKLYANFTLQLAYYLPMQIVGWWIWLRWGPSRNDDLPIRRLSLRVNLSWIGVTVAATVLCGYLLQGTDGRIPYWDASTTALSVVGQFMLTRKWLENWVYWIVADVIYVLVLFPSQKLYLSAGLYTVLTFMSIQGLVAWLRAETKGAAHA